MGQFEETNAYIGIVPLSEIYNPFYWILLFAWLTVVTWLIPIRVRAPSDVFLIFYLVGACIWSACYWPATGLLSGLQAVLLALMLIFPAVLVKFGRVLVFSNILNIRVNFGVRVNFSFPVDWLMPVVCGLLLLAAAVSYSIAGGYGSFNLSEGYVRRLAGRDSFAENGFAAYLMQMSMNGLAPFLAYLGAIKRSSVALLMAVVFAIFSYWLIGVKAPLINVTVLAFLGYWVHFGKLANFATWFLRALWLILFLAVIELKIFDYSVLTDYGVRRFALVNANIQSYFFDAMGQQGWDDMLVSGLNFSGFSSPEFFVGYFYMNDELTNANTNAYLHQTAIGGITGYLMAVFLTVAVTFVLDFMYFRRGRVEVFAISAIFGILLIEQAVMTAMVSSGIVLCILLVLMFSRDKEGVLQRNRPHSFLGASLDSK